MSQRDNETKRQFGKRLTCRRRECKAPTQPRDCPVCGATLAQRDNERPEDFASRKTCGRRCGKTKTFDILGVVMTAADIAEIAGVSPSTVLYRGRTGRDPLTGKALGRPLLVPHWGKAE